MHADGYVRVARLAALKDADALADALDTLAEPPDRIAATLRAHHVGSLVCASLSSASDRPRFDALLQAIDRLRRFPFLTSTECMVGFEEVRARLEARGVDVLLLKGVYFAERLYGGSRWRPQFDMDILIHAAARRRARRALIDAGFDRTAYDLHSTTFTRGCLKVDVHGWLRRAPAYHLDEQSIWSTAQSVIVAGLGARTLSDEFALVMLVLSLFEDVGQGMARLKQLLDGYLLLRQMDAATDWDAFFDRRACENIASIAGAMLHLLMKLFHAEGEMPCLHCSPRDATRVVHDDDARGDARPGVRASQTSAEHGVVPARLPGESVSLPIVVLDGRLPRQRACAVTEPRERCRPRRAWSRTTTDRGIAMTQIQKVTEEHGQHG